MSIAIDLTDLTGDPSLLEHPVTVTRPKTATFVDDENATAGSHRSMVCSSASEKQMLALQMVGTFVMLTACLSTFAGCIWLLFEFGSSVMEQLSLLNPSQILQGMAGR
jgi:hypothetical protein